MWAYITLCCWSYSIAPTIAITTTSITLITYYGEGYNLRKYFGPKAKEKPRKGNEQ